MALLVPADSDALSKVSITIDGHDGPFQLKGGENLMFPPKISKDSKSAVWKEVQSGGYEPWKMYEYSNSRSIILDFEWVVGGNFPPAKVHDTVSRIKSYFYRPYFSGNAEFYPVVAITSFYEVIPAGHAFSPSTWRIMDVTIKYSDELANIQGKWYPLHVQLAMSLEAVTKLKPIRAEGESVHADFKNLRERPGLEWF